MSLDYELKEKTGDVSVSSKRGKANKLSRIEGAAL